MDRELNLPPWESAPAARVEYYPEGQILFIENGQQGVVGEEMAENVIVHYEKDEANQQASAVVIRIDRAEYVLKPFVDAILAKYGLKQVAGQETNGNSSIADGVPGD